MSLPLTSAETQAVDAWLATFHPYQVRWMLDPARFAFCNKGRQLGLSHANSGGCIVGGLLQRRSQIILSASQDLSDEVMLKVRAHCALLAELGCRRAADFVVDNASEIAWRSGGRVIALPANPRTARSYTGDVWLDEFAYHQDPRGIRDAAFPIAMRGGWRIRVVSTPNGAHGLFYEMASRQSPGWSHHEIPLDLATSEGLEVDLEDLWKLCDGDERLFGQWFQCHFLDAQLQYIPTALVETAKQWVGEMSRLSNAEWFAGLDVGRNRDLTALAIVAVEDGVAWVVDIMTAKRTDFAEQKAMIRTARQAFRWNTLHVDETGLGMNLAEDLQKEFGKTEVVPIRFDLKSKEDLFTRAFRYHRNCALRYPPGELGETLAREAISLRRVVSDIGNVCYEFPRTADGHGDHFTALALALKGAGEPATPRGMGRRPLFAVA